MNKLLILYSEECVDFTVILDDGTKTHIKNFNYDDHGSAGLRDVVQAMVAVAKATGMDVVEEETSDDEEDNIPSLAKQVTAAQAEMATWPADKRTSVRLEGGDA